MRISFLFIVVSIVMSAYAYASPISQQWVKSYGGESGGNLGIIKQTMEGGYIGAGTTRSSSAILVRKLNHNGEISWEKTYAYGDWMNEAYTMQQTSDGGYIVGGHTFSRDSYDNAWLIKLDSNGDITWQKTYNEVWRFTSIQQTSDGGYIAGGDYIQEVAPDMQDNDLILLKLDSMGNISWAKSYDQSLGDYVPSILQTPDLGYMVMGNIGLGLFDFDILLLKLDSSGGVSWQKRYGRDGLYRGFSIHHTTDGGYIISGESRGSGAGASDIWLLKLDQNGNTLWQKTYGGHDDDYIFSLQQTPDGGYTVLGNTHSFGLGMSDILAVKLDDTGSIIWQKTYGGNDSDYGIYYGKTMDGGSVVVGYSHSLSAGNLTIFKLDSNGDIPGCDIIGISDLEIFNTEITGEDTSVTIESPPITVTATNIIPQETLAEVSVVCYFEDPNDIDGDGVENNPDGAMSSSAYGGSFLADEDNCSEAPNGPFLGTCTKGNLGSTCIADQACGDDGICSMNQEDSYPPSGNVCGDACECEGNFNPDEDDDVDGSDAAIFKTDFGRGGYDSPCTGSEPCNGDFDCDTDVDGSDASLFKSDYGRSLYNSPCPACEVGEWCNYSEPPSTTTTMPITTTSTVPATTTTSSPITTTTTTNPLACELAISPTSATVYTWESIQFSTTLNGECNTPCNNWEVLSSIGSTIDSNGLYTAGDTAGSDTVTVTDNCNMDISDSAYVNVLTPTTITTTIAP